jgi:CS domain
MSSTTSFTFVRIPADEKEPVEELTASKAGGLEHDELIKYAKEYFYKQLLLHSTSSSSSTSEEYPSCDIMALSVPLSTNGYQAVSLYSNNYSSTVWQQQHHHPPLQVNRRATALVIACGHSLVSSSSQAQPQQQQEQRPIRGDVFVGRAHDDERIEWERLDFTAADADPTAPWCRLARSPGGGGGQGGKFPTAASSLTTLLQQQMNVATAGGQPQQQMITGDGASGSSSTGNNHHASMFGMDGAPAVREEWGSWTQTQDEIELKVPLTEGSGGGSVVKAKDCQVLFKRQSLKVLVGNVVKVEGTLFGSIVPDDCTYTIETGGGGGGGGGRELCITLTKAEERMTWSWVIMS